MLEVGLRLRQTGIGVEREFAQRRGLLSQSQEATARLSMFWVLSERCRGSDPGKLLQMPLPCIGFLGGEPQNGFLSSWCPSKYPNKKHPQKDTHFPDPKGFWLQAAAVPALQASSGSAEAKPEARKGSVWCRVLKLGKTCCKFTTSHIGACQSELPFGRVRFTRESLGSNTEENQEETGNPTKASKIRLQDPYVRPVHVGNHGTNHKQQTRSHKRKPIFFDSLGFPPLFSGPTEIPACWWMASIWPCSSSLLATPSGLPTAAADGCGSCSPPT